MNSSRVLVIDHHDSFSFVLGEQFARVGAEVRTHRCDLSVEALELVIATYGPHLVVLSPGPGGPESTGVTLPWLATRPPVPVLGVCLGHQALAVAFGGAIGRAPQPVHGKASAIELRDAALGFDQPVSLRVARYHSLCVTEVPASFEVTARTRDGDRALVMAMRHRELPYVGFQFHPESILTPSGGPLIERVLATCGLARPTTSSSNNVHENRP